MSKLVALGKVHRRAKGAVEGRSLCGLELSLVDYDRELPKCNTCRIYAGLKPATHVGQSVKFGDDRGLEPMEAQLL